MTVKEREWVLVSRCSWKGNSLSLFDCHLELFLFHHFGAQINASGLSLRTAWGRQTPNESLHALSCYEVFMFQVFLTCRDISFTVVIANTSDRSWLSDEDDVREIWQDFSLRKHRMCCQCHCGNVSSLSLKFWPVSGSFLNEFSQIAFYQWFRWVWQLNLPIIKVCKSWSRLQKCAY